MVILSLNHLHNKFDFVSVFYNGDYKWVVLLSLIKGKCIATDCQRKEIENMALSI